MILQFDIKEREAWEKHAVCSTTFGTGKLEYEWRTCHKGSVVLGMKYVYSYCVNEYLKPLFMKIQLRYTLWFYKPGNSFVFFAFVDVVKNYCVFTFNFFKWIILLN